MVRSMKTHRTGEAAPRRALFFGDSLVAGVGDPAGGGWVARVVSACFQRGVALTAYNLGVRGETSVQVAGRWRAEAIPRVPAGADARIVMSFGANDTTVERGAVRVPPEKTCEALATILDETSLLGFASFVVGPAPVDDAEQNRRISALTRSLTDICQERDTPFIDVAGPLLESSVWMNEVAAGDGAHPQTAGYDTLAELLTDGDLVAWLCQPVATAATVEGAGVPVDRGVPRV